MLRRIGSWCSAPCLRPQAYLQAALTTWLWFIFDTFQEKPTARVSVRCPFFCAFDGPNRAWHDRLGGSANASVRCGSTAGVQCAFQGIGNCSLLFPVSDRLPNHGHAERSRAVGKAEHTRGTAPFFFFSYARALLDSFVCECGGDRPSGTLKLMVGRSWEALSPSLKDTLSERCRGHAVLCGKRCGPSGGLLFFLLRREPAGRECCVVLLSGRVFVFENLPENR